MPMKIGPEALSLILLGIRSAWKEDLKASSAELVYGSPLRLTAGFFAPPPSECTDATVFDSRLRVHIGKLRPVPASRHAAPSAFIFKDLATVSLVFVRYGALRGALQAPYVGLYTVLHRGDKTYSIEVRGTAKTVSIDRLKLAYVLHVNTESSSPPVIPSSITTRSRRRVHMPDYLGVQRSELGGGRWRGGRHWLAHPRSQGILSPIHHNVINIETESRVKWELESGVSV